MKQLLLLSFILFLSVVNAQDERQQMPYAEGEVLIMVDNADNLSEIVSDLQFVDGVPTRLDIKKELSADANIWQLIFDFQAIDHQEMLVALYGNRHVLIAQNNHRITERSTIPDDPDFAYQWHHAESGDHDIDSDLAWDITTGGVTPNGDTIVVAVVEGGGADWNHPDLIANHWINYGEIPGNSIDDDGNGYIDDYNGWNTETGDDVIATGNHGTGVSGMIGAVGNNANNLSGVNWNVKIMQVDMASGLTEAHVIEAYTYPLKLRKMYNASNGSKGAFVVATNSSWGVDGGNPADAPLWCAFYDTLGLHGILSCAATANSNWNIDVVGDLPTACGSDYLISVTATNNSDLRTFSGYGATTIDLGAPGENVYTLENGGGYGPTSGTSFASPLTAGVIALMYSAPCTYLADLSLINPQQAADKVRAALLNGVDPVSNLSGECVTGGRLNAKGAIDELILDCDSGSGIEEQNKSIELVYPNPATDVIAVELVKDESATFALQDGLGRTVIRETINDGLGSISVSGLAAGAYSYSIRYNDGTYHSGMLIIR